MRMAPLSVAGLSTNRSISRVTAAPRIWRNIRPRTVDAPEMRVRRHACGRLAVWPARLLDRADLGALQPGAEETRASLYPPCRLRDPTAPAETNSAGTRPGKLLLSCRWFTEIVDGAFRRGPQPAGSGRYAHKDPIERAAAHLCGLGDCPTDSRLRAQTEKL